MHGSGANPGSRCSLQHGHLLFLHYEVDSVAVGRPQPASAGVWELVRGTAYNADMSCRPNVPLADVVGVDHCCYGPGRSLDMPTLPASCMLVGVLARLTLMNLSLLHKLPTHPQQTSC